MLISVFMDKLMSTGMSMSVLVAVFAVIFFALRSKSDGKELVKKVVEKRNLIIEIILFAMAIIEGFNAATYAVKEGRDFGASIAMHVLGGMFSGAFAFAISKQVYELVLAIRDQKHSLIIIKEAVDVIGSVILAVVAPILNSYFVAIAAHGANDFWSMVTFDFSHPIRNASVMFSTGLGMLHIFGCFVLSWSSFDTSLLENTSNGGTEPELPFP